MCVLREKTFSFRTWAAVFGASTELLGDVLEGRIKPGRVFDSETDLDDIAEAYGAMDERRAIKSLIWIATKETGR
jgi:threonine dehydrogenase-like Zn-dependent dehydrogenase